MQVANYRNTGTIISFAALAGLAICAVLFTTGSIGKNKNLATITAGAIFIVSAKKQELLHLQNIMYLDWDWY